MPKNDQTRTWAEQELVAVLSLYCQIDFGKIYYRNPSVRRLAELLDRTPSAVALKLANFASLDPVLQSRGVRGMQNASRLDRKIWANFYGKWDELASSEIAQEAGEKQWTGGPTSVKRLVASRRGQGFFRNAVLSAYGGKCCITGIAIPELLRGSHIVPWSKSAEQRLDPANGLCLNALHDAAFDSGLITLDTRLNVRVSKATRTAMPENEFDQFFGQYDGKSIQPPTRFSPDVSALHYHHENVFIS